MRKLAMAGIMSAAPSPSMMDHPAISMPMFTLRAAVSVPTP